jgi:hypothetical protein
VNLPEEPEEFQTVVVTAHLVKEGVEILLSDVELAEKDNPLYSESNKVFRHLPIYPSMTVTGNALL